MNHATRRRLWSGAALALGLVAIAVVFDRDASKSQNPYLILAFLSLCIAGIVVCLRARYRIDLQPDDDSRKTLRAALAHGELRGAASPSLAAILGMPAMTVLMSALAYANWHDADYLSALLMAAVAALFGVGGIWLLRQRLQPRELRIDAAGIHSPQSGLIAWDDIVGMRRHYGRVVQTDFEALQLCLRNHRRYFDRVPAWQRGFSGTRAGAYAPLILMVSQYGIRADTAYLTALSLRRRIAAAFVEDWEPEMDDAEIDEYLAARAPVAVAAPNAALPQRLQAQQTAGTALSQSRARQRIRQRARERRWHEGVWRRAIIGVLGTAAYVLVMGWLDGLFD